ncbi:hypothetical protein DIPPA_05406 [Diplonema papillatum]|nr:hypothetical protein DIPPA_05406 [Diplonema papillatum]
MAFTLSHDSVRLAAGAPQTLTVTNGSSDAASFKIRLTHPANTTAKPAKGDLAPGESAPFEVATATPHCAGAPQQNKAAKFTGTTDHYRRKRKIPVSSEIVS